MIREVNETTQFPDIESNSYGAFYVLCARALGLISEREDGSFGPKDDLKRIEMASFMARLWRDVLGQNCPDESHPFEDVRNDPLEADVACLYSLNIAKGYTGISYEPLSDLQTWHVTLFIFRMLSQLMDNPCDIKSDEVTADSELKYAAECLTRNNIIPDIAEAESMTKIIRAQMAVYVTSAWYYASGQGVPPKPPSRPTDLLELSDVEVSLKYVAVAAGGSHSCGLRSDASVVCWGDRVAGQLDVPEGEYVAVVAGGSHSCGLRSDASVVCAGAKVLLGSWMCQRGEYVAVAAGGSHSCGLRSDASVVCWGSVDDAPEERFSAITASTTYSCGLLDSGLVKCWGYNRRGETNALTGRFSIIASGDSQSCGLRISRNVECWGDDFYGQVSSVPEGSYSDIAVGGRHVCALNTKKAIVCWGDGEDGQSEAPLEGEYKAISAGHSHNCALNTAGSLVCWGDSLNGKTIVPRL